MLKKLSLGFISILCIALLSQSASAGNHMDVSVSVAMSPPAPPTRGLMLPPQGYLVCHSAPGGWMGNIWVAPHRECEYPAPKGRALWVSGYWGCVAVGPDGDCGRWKWFGHRWARGRAVAYHGEHVRPVYAQNRHYLVSGMTVR